MKIFGYVLVPEQEHKELIECWHRSHRLAECYRWFSGWKDLDIIWDYISGNSKYGIEYARCDYAHLRKTDVYGNKIKKVSPRKSKRSC
jgi:hypothetical protein